MLKTFITSFKLQNTYRTNSIIYSIKQLPLIKRILPNSLYKNRGLKIFANIIGILLEIINIFLGKLIYIAAMIFGPLSWYNVNGADIFLHLFIFLTFAGGVLNTYMLNPTKDKYYAIILIYNTFWNSSRCSFVDTNFITIFCSSSKTNCNELYDM